MPIKRNGSQGASKGPEEFFTRNVRIEPLVHLHGGPAPVRRFLPKLIDLIFERKIDPGKVRSHLAAGPGGGRLRAMDERRAIKALLRP